MDEIPQLAARGLSLETLAAHVRPLQEDECLLLVGSIAEGLANRASDVDLLLIGARAPFTEFQLARVQFEAETVQVSPDAEIGIETCEPDYLHRLQAIMTQAAEALDDPAGTRRVPLLTEPDAVILHRLRTGIPLINGPIVERWRAELRLDVLPELLALSATVDHFARREDGLSHAEEGDYEVATICLRDAASYAASLLLASVGESHPSTRWRLPLLRRHVEELGEETVARLRSAMLDPVRSRADVETLVPVFDGIVIEAASRLPRAAAVGAALAQRFHVEDRLGDDSQMDELVNAVTSAAETGSRTRSSGRSG